MMPIELTHNPTATRHVILSKKEREALLMTAKKTEEELKTQCEAKLKETPTEVNEAAVEVG